MKKKVLIAMLSTAMATTIFAGCGETEPVSNTSVESSVVTEQQESSETSVETTETSKETKQSDETATSTEAGAETTEESKTEETAASKPTETKAENETTTASEVATTASSGNKKTESSQPAEGNKAEAEQPKATEEPKVEEVKEQYTYTDMDKTMYAVRSVNVRDLPSTDGNKVDSLKAGDEVKVTGQCNETGWYRLADGNYVSNNYLTADKPIVVQPTTTPSSTTDTSSQQGTTPAPTQTATQPQAEVTAVSRQDFVTHLNSQRNNAGLSSLNWDSGLEAIALERAKEIASDYSHNGMRGCNGEIILNNTSDSTTMFTTWYNSEGHRNIMYGDFDKVACASYGNYAVCVFTKTPKVVVSDTPAPTPEELQEKIDSGELHEISSSTNEDGTASVTTYGSDGVTSVQPGEEGYDDLNKMFEDLGF